jgi:hypothetical protein
MAFLKQGLAIILMALLAGPSWASTPMFGTVQESSAAMVRGTPLVAGTTVFSEDKIEVGPNGHALIAFQGGAQLQLQANSQAQILRADKAERLQVEVQRGVARFRSSAQTQLEAVLADATIRPANGSVSAGYISFLSPTTAVIGAEKGALMITTAHDGANATIPEGSSMSVRLVSDDTGSGVKPAVQTGRRKVVLLGLIIMGGVVGASIAANEAESSNKSPTSPFRP